MKKILLVLTLFFSWIFMVPLMAQVENPALSGQGEYKAGAFEERGKGELPSFKFIFSTEFPQGVNHIFTGADHIAFVLALALVVFTVLNLIKVITFFTIAHAFTLTIASLDLIPIGKIGVLWIEFGVAVSIAWVGVENLIWREKIPVKRRSFIAFFFGLIHGLAFSEHFRESMVYVNLSDPAHLFRFLTKILGFNLGVDVGQLIIAFAVFFLFLGLKVSVSETVFIKLRHKLISYGSGIIALFGFVWALERLAKIL